MILLDHLAVSGETREEARAYVEQSLGVPMQDGGEHDVFFTHNALLALEDGLYLEAIAVNPHAATPKRPRWFDLDRFSGPPRLTNWICSTTDLRAALETLLPQDFGQPVDLQRGDLKWQMAVPESGVLPFENAAPALIEWQTTRHPARKLTPRGVSLARVTLRHPAGDKLKVLLSPILSDDRVRIEQGERSIHAEFFTPQGPREITG